VGVKLQKKENLGERDGGPMEELRISFLPKEGRRGRSSQNQPGAVNSHLGGGGGPVVVSSTEASGEKVWR